MGPQANSGTGPALAGPPTFKDWSEDPKLEKKMIVGNWKQTVKQLKAHDLRPKKVGLLSFMIWDVGDFQYSALAYTYAARRWRRSRRRFGRS